MCLHYVLLNFLIRKDWVVEWNGWNVIVLWIVCWINTEQANGLFALLWWLSSDDIINPRATLELFAQASPTLWAVSTEVFYQNAFGLCLPVVHGTSGPVLRTLSQSYHLPKHLILEEVAVKYWSEILPPFAPHVSFSKFPSCKVSTLPLFPDCYHNSLALYHQNVSSYLLSKNSCFLSAVLQKGKTNVLLSWRQCECGIIPRKSVADTIPSYVDCFLVATDLILAKFFVPLWKVLIPLLIL